jgi:FKBP-type peptidyl-prolyl cis-trans isomerase FkpA
MIRLMCLALAAALLSAPAPAMAQNARANLKASEVFLARNAKAKGVMVTKSGLQYQVLRPGKGAKAGPNDTVSVHYKGWLPQIPSVPFDQSYGGPAVSFGVREVVPGWTEALQLMNKGAKFRLWLPPKLGYGEEGASPSIPPNSVLVFDVELLDIKR